MLAHTITTSASVYDSTYEGLKRTGLGLAGTNPGLRLCLREPVILSSGQQELLSGAPIIFSTGIIKDRTNETLYQPAPLSQATPPSSVAAPIPGTWHYKTATHRTPKVVTPVARSVMKSDAQQMKEYNRALVL